MNTIRVGTRGSPLALTQTNLVLNSLRIYHPHLNVEVVVIKTTGDLRRTVAFAEVGTKGMFVKEIEEALLDGRIDFAVHSLKDMPGELPSGLVLASVPRREDPRDALLSDGRRLADLPSGARLGTSSLRRQAQVRAQRPDLKVMELRGNLDTRIRKLDEGRYDAILLACAGLERMGWEDRIVERLSTDLFVPAPGQGALALETREADEPVRGLLASLHDIDTADAVTAERAFQTELNAGCTVPIGAYAALSGDRLTLLVMKAEPDGSGVQRFKVHGPRSEAREIGTRAAERLLGA